ncbi:hypothetical protein ACAH01_11530 [Halomicrobium sp. HM KBTZ05]|uniref:Uncharacterized protein n=1 Tax=Halomicrobium mukohataei TaxID=57705 RepID=A0A847UG32_9EURY|nr:hypothetical protein [Halomicrobium mukohataei]NLV10141.1 hypothetical protein [Halomicrobium mukohataei]
MSAARHRWRGLDHPEFVGAVVVVVFSFAVGKLGLLPTTAIVANGFLGGVVAGTLTAWDDAGYYRGALAAVVATPLLLAVHVVDDFVISGRYDVVLTTLGRPPGTLVDQLIVYGIYEGLAVSLPAAVALATGLVGGAVGFRLRRLFARRSVLR